MINRKQVTVLAAAIFCLAAVQGKAGGAIIQVDENLNDNLTPSGFNLSTTNTAGLSNGRLEATRVNGSGALAYTSLPANLSQIDISYRGHFGYSLWGTYTVVALAGLPVTLTHGANEFNHGLNNFATIGSGGTNLIPFNFSDFEYDITVVDGQVSFTGTDIVTGTEAFSMTHADAGIVLSDITQISFRAHNTTGTEAVWLDDIKMQLHTVEVPEPGTPVLFALGLFAFSVAKRRRAV